MARAPIGLKVRDRRKALGVTQAALANRLGISPSYLNLIENGKRAIGGKLLVNLAQQLNVELESLDAASDRRLVSQLQEAIGHPLVAEHQPPSDTAVEVVGRYPEWAKALVALHRGYLDRDRLARALGDRLNQDPFLNEAVHGVLSNAAAIRSTAEILESVRDLDDEQQHRFHRSLVEESERLSEVSRAMASFFEGAASQHRSVSPTEEVDDLLIERSNYFPALEIGAERLRRVAGITDERVKTRLIDHLNAEHGIIVKRVSGTEAGVEQDEALEDRPARPVFRNFNYFDKETRVFHVLESAPETTKRFELAKLAAKWDLREEIEAIVDRSEMLTTIEARRRASNALAAYAGGAVLMPYDTFLSHAQACRYDLDRLSREFGASYEQVAHRLVTLRKRGAEGIPFAFMRCDPSGYVSKRFPLPGLGLPRYGGACPLWVIYRAFQTPEAVVRQLVEFPGGASYLFFARAISKEGGSYDRPRHLMSLMLATDAKNAEEVVYGDGLALGRRASPEPVGPSCGLCVRHACTYRQEAAVLERDRQPFAPGLPAP